MSQDGSALAGISASALLAIILSTAGVAALPEDSAWIGFVERVGFPAFVVLIIFGGAAKMFGPSIKAAIDRQTALAALAMEMLPKIERDLGRIAESTSALPPRLDKIESRQKEQERIIRDLPCRQTGGNGR